METEKHERKSYFGQYGKELLSVEYFGSLGSGEGEDTLHDLWEQVWDKVLSYWKEYAENELKPLWEQVAESDEKFLWKKRRVTYRVEIKPRGGDTADACGNDEQYAKIEVSLFAGEQSTARWIGETGFRDRNGNRGPRGEEADAVCVCEIMWDKKREIVREVRLWQTNVQEIPLTNLKIR